MNKKLILLFFCLFFYTLCISQTTTKKLFYEAEWYFINEEFEKAIPIYQKLLNIDTSNYNYKYLLALSYYETGEKKYIPEALKYFELASKKCSKKYKNGSYKEVNAPLETWFYLGLCYRYLYEFDKALKAFNTFLELAPSGNPYIDYVKREIQCTQNAKYLVKNSISIDSIPIDTFFKFQKKYLISYPLLSDDKNVFIFVTNEGSINTTKSSNSIEYKTNAIFFTRKENNKWIEPKNILPQLGINIRENKVVPVALNSNGTELYIVKDDFDDGNIYVSYYKNGKWSSLEKLNKNINTKYWESHASISKDGKTLYFTSERPGGFGGLDIYKSEKNENGDWGEAINLGPTVNSIYDEELPFIIEDSNQKVLYFFSQGHFSMGGFDLFYSKQLPNGNWTTPVNVGHPINTSENDLYYIQKYPILFYPINVKKIENINKFIKISEKKPTQLAELPDKTETQTINIKESTKEKNFVLRCNIFLTDNKELPDNSKIIIYDEKNYTIKSFTKPDKFPFFEIKLPPSEYKLEYNIPEYESKLQYIQLDNDFPYDTVFLDIALNPIEVKKEEYIIIKNIFFDFGKYNIRKEGEIELHKLAKVMHDNPDLKVEVTGHTDIIGSDEYNLKLSYKRAQSVINYLASLGIAPDRFVAKGLGKSQFIAINTNIDGTDNPEGRQLNRRVEIKLLGDVKNVIIQPINVPPNLVYRKEKISEENYYTVVLFYQKEKLIDINLLNKTFDFGKILKTDTLFKNISDPLNSSKNGDIILFTTCEFKNKIDAYNVLLKAINFGFDDAFLCTISEMKSLKNELFKESYESTTSEAEQKASDKFFVIQLVALNTPIDKESYFQKVANVKIYYCKDGYFRYITGKFKNKEEANRQKEKLIELGFPGAFVVDWDYFKTNIKENESFTIILINSPKPLNISFFRELKDKVQELILPDGNYAYAYDTFNDINKAFFKLKEVIKKGYKNAYIYPLSKLK